MQTKKKVVARNASKEHANPRLSRQQKKVTMLAERKATELITSSAKKKKNGRILSSKYRDEAVENLNASCLSSQDETRGICMAYESPIDHKPDDRATQCVLETIFSPAFHLPKDACGGFADKVDFMNFFRSRDQPDCQDYGVEKSKLDILSYRSMQENQQNTIENRIVDASTCTCNNNTNMMDKSTESSDGQSNHSHAPPIESNDANTIFDEEYRGLGNLSSEVSAIYLAMQHSKLECIDEPSQDTLSADSCGRAEEDDEFDDFDPYLFIKKLPDLSAVVPTFRPMLLPKQTRSCPSITLVLDLDETLVHSTLEPCDNADFTFPVNFNLKEHTVYVRCRPYLKDFMERVASLFEIIIFTASQSIYAEQLLNVLDPRRKLFRHRVYRESCVYVEGNYLKDLSVLGRDLARVIIIDNSPQAFGFQIDNGIPIESWFDDRTDQELLTLLPFLESLVGVEDVRPFIAQKFNLREKVAAAASLT